MKWILIGALLFLAFSDVLADDTLKCYICEPSNAECEVGSAHSVKCGNQKTSRCSKQVKRGASDDAKAIRKCVVPDTKGNIPCPDGYDCAVCDKDLCNSGSVAKLTWISMTGILFSVLYLN